MRKYNKGLSLIEMTVVVGVMVVLVGFTLYSTSSIPRYRARECSRKITSNLNETKVTSLGKAKSTGDIVWEIYKKENRVYLRTLINCKSAPEVYKNDKISKGNPKVIIQIDGGAREELANGEGLMLCFDRATGALYSCGGIKHSFAESPSPGECAKDASPTTVAEIIVSPHDASGEMQFVTSMVAMTGKISDYMERKP